MGMEDGRPNEALVDEPIAHPLTPCANATLSLIEGRRSVRGFEDRPVGDEILRTVLRAAARAPSANNTQPWTAHVVRGATKQRLTDAIMAERASGAPEPPMEYQYYPAAWPEPYAGRRREVGWSLYGMLGIKKGDRIASRAWHDKNFDFFGAPVGVILTTDRRLGLGALIDIGLFMEGVAIAARSVGLETCLQAAFASYHQTVRSVLSLAPEEMVVCGMAIGLEDRSVLANSLRTKRVAVSDFTTFHD
jgi:nitroreductase